MLKVSSQEFQRKTGLYQEKAKKEGVTITRYGRDSLVLIDAEAYYQLRKRARIVLGAGELSDEDISQIQQTSMSSVHDHLNSELD